MRKDGTAGAAWADDPPTVLVIDDDYQLRRVLELGLQRHGFGVVSAGNGREAIELFHGLREWSGSPVVLMDVQMPGLDGPLVLSALQAIDPDLQAYFMTGDPDPYTADELLARGARAVFGKPLDFVSVVAELRRGLEHGRVPVTT